MNKNLNGIIFDLESTCDDKSKNPNFDNECIEIGAVKIINGEIVEEFQTFIKPQFTQVNKFCTELTSIRGIDVKDAPLFEEAIENFKQFANDLTLLSWGFYDRKQLEKDSKRYGLDIEWLENHRSLKHEYGEMKQKEVAESLSKGEVVSSYKRKKKGYGVQAALRMEGMSFEGVHHRGIDDARNIARIYIKAFKK